MRPRLLIYADGSGDDRPGKPGGWAFAVVRGEELVAEGWGHAEVTSCLAMEFAAAREGLAAVRAAGWHEHAEVELVSDCSIALEVASGRFMPKPQRHRADAEALRAAFEGLGATTRWVRAHAGNAWNEAVDLLARLARTGEL